MKSITLADVAHQSIHFSGRSSSELLVMSLMEQPWFQRLRDISQTANTRLVYMFSEHSRFGHSLGVAYLAQMVMEQLAQTHREAIDKFCTAVSAAALLHDIGHIAPGSHTAFKTWFPDQPDTHEDVAAKIIREDPALRAELERHGVGLPELVCQVLAESDTIPAWTWEIISGGGWNVDRGNWCIVDSILAGVSYGKYNIPALIESLVITPDGHLALAENRLDSMMHFAVSRHAMYRQIYQHRVLLAADTLNQAVVRRARDLGDKLDFADEAMRSTLAARSPADLSLDTIFFMREAWWRYHLMRWSLGSDPILADLSKRLLNRALFKTVRIGETDSVAELTAEARHCVESVGFDPRYYLHTVSTGDPQAGDNAQSIKVLMDDGRVRALAEAEPLFNVLVRESGNLRKSWLVMPESAKRALGRFR